MRIVFIAVGELSVETARLLIKRNLAKLRKQFLSEKGQNDQNPKDTG